MIKVKSAINYLLFFLVIFLPLYYFSTEPFIEPDVGWHIKAGYLIRELRALPEYDPWAFTSDQKWINLSWGWDIICSYITDIMPIQYLKIVNAVLYALLLTFGFKMLDKFGSMRVEAKFLSIFLAGLVLHDWMYFRPQIISFFLLITLYQLLNQSKTNASIGKIFAILAIIILWANVHGMVIIAFPIIGAFIIEALVEKRYPWLFFLISTFITSCLALLINPYNYEIFSGILLTIDSVATEFIIEWNSFQFLESIPTSIFVCLFVMIANVTNPRVPLAVKILTYLWFIAALYSKRSFPIFALIALPYMALCIDDLMKKVPQFQTRLPITILMVITLGGFSKYYGTIYSEQEFSPSSIPYKEITFVKENFPGRHFFNEYNIGGYIIYYGNGEFKHFIDGRAGTVFSEDVLRDYRDFLSTGQFQAIVDRYDVYGAIFGYYLSNNPDFMYNFRHWKQVYAGDYGVVLINTKKERRF